MNCFFSRNYKDPGSAGNKAKADIESILLGMGFTNIGNRSTNYPGEPKAFLATLASVLKAVSNLSGGDVLVVQYPLKKYFSFVCRAAHRKGAKVIALIHDLGSFRRKALTPDKEIARLSNADYIIAHNDSMRQWLISKGMRKPVGTLGIFDYLSGSQNNTASEAVRPYRVIYAGNLSRRKNAFLYNVGKNIRSYRLKLYGRGFDSESAEGKDNFETMGFVDSDKLIATVQGDFGLVWDGDSTEGCTGDFGEYLQYNNPHKTSLYLRCCLPVILWKKAALAPFIEENRIGICIGSLGELNDVLDSLSPEEYAEMKNNASRMATLLQNGHFTSKAVGEALAAL